MMELVTNKNIFKPVNTGQHLVTYAYAEWPNWALHRSALKRAR